MTDEDWCATTFCRDVQHCKSVGTTLSKMNGAVDPYDVAEATVSGKISDEQPNLWIFDNGTRNLKNFEAFYGQSLVSSTADRQTSFTPPAFFTSSLPVGTDTGILQALALRLNTSLDCEDIPHSRFPASCDGTTPFATSYSNAELPEARADNYGGPIFTFRACAPGPISWVPGENRQEMSEDLYMDLQSSRSPAKHNFYNENIDSVAAIVSNFSYHCTSKSTLAVFEAPNSWNGHQVQDVFDLRPARPDDPWQPDISSVPWSVKGPFFTSILAIFGNYTLFDNIANANDTHDTNLEISQALRMALTGLCTDMAGMCTPYNASYRGNTLLDCVTPGAHDRSNPNTDHKHQDGTLAFYLFLFLQKFNNLNSTIAALTLTNYYSSRAILDPSMSSDRFTAYTSPGLGIQKVHVPLAGLISISILILPQLTGLCSLALYASHDATWTDLLDSFALPRLGAAIADELPLISASEAKELAVLDEKEGWVGDAGNAERVRMLLIGGGRIC